jgi:DNA invertase Pin-like site-specific DNA recombinase
MRAVILARVSTKEQEEEGHSLPAQVRRLQEYAQKKGFEVVQEFVFSESAGNKIRTKFLEMLEFIKKNKDVKILLAQNVDRVTRNFRDAVDLDEMRIREGLEIHFVQDGFFINKDATGNQRFMWEAKVFLAKQYLNRLSDDVKRSIEQKIINNEWYGKAPIGYKNIELEDGKKWIVSDPQKKDLIIRMFELYANDGYSMEMLRAMTKKDKLIYGINSKNGLSKGHIDQILKNPFYYGEMDAKGKLTSHRYETLISKELFDSVQEIKKNHHKKSFKFAGKELLFRSLITCEECGCAISFDKKVKHYKKTNRTATYIYGRCTNYFKKHKKTIWVKEEELIKQISKLLKGMTIPEKTLEYLKIEMNKSHEDKKAFHENAMANLRTEQAKMQRRLELMYEDRLEGRITPEIYQDLRKSHGY